MKDISTLDANFDTPQRQAILADAQAWYTQHSQVKKFITKDRRAQKLFPLPENTNIIRDTFAPGETASSAKEAPCTIANRSS